MKSNSQGVDGLKIEIVSDSFDKWIGMVGPKCKGSVLAVLPGTGTTDKIYQDDERAAFFYPRTDSSD